MNSGSFLIITRIDPILHERGLIISFLTCKFHASTIQRKTSPSNALTKVSFFDVRLFAKKDMLNRFITVFEILATAKTSQKLIDRKLAFRVLSISNLHVLKISVTEGFSNLF